MHLAIDAMGGDQGPRAAIGGCLQALRQYPSLSLTLYGQQAALEHYLSSSSLSALGKRITLKHIAGVLSTSMSPSAVLRNTSCTTTEMTSLHAAVGAVADGDADGCVSGGDTGALMALSRQRVGMLEGIARPAISSPIPTLGKRCYLLDLGANVDCQPRHLVQFAEMGSQMVRLLDGVERPRVAVLNIGSEQHKGGRLQRTTHELLNARTEHCFEYCGFIEGDAIFNGAIDVVVCDGFVGNVALKTSEGLTRLLADRLQAAFSTSLVARLVSLLARPALARFREEMNPVRYNGASLLGLAGTVVKSHGAADSRGFFYAVERAVKEVHEQLPQRLKASLAV
ncbi:phosphate acyltransferase PlsX [Carnimonas nigrificans]|uniref:phosphate acyltransferase PlsX n=1 Tax=Carnimonas nigrificans TaxID=64323 RepID=UPI0004722565|nr:phosphate acyltransferase PlsX [Carnimonas nigrificans]